MLSDLLEYKILINGTFAKIDVVRYNSPEEEEEFDVLGIKPTYEQYIDRVWINTPL